MDVHLRLLERKARHDPHARFKLHAWEDRLAWPDALKLLGA